MSLVPSSKPLTQFKVLSFDVLGTLIDCETGMYNALTSSLPFSHLAPDNALKDRKHVLGICEKYERKMQKENPGVEYSQLLAEAFESLCRDFKLELENSDEMGREAQKFGNSVGNWPAFPDTVDGLGRLKKHYRLVPLTNSSPMTIGASIAGPLQNFDFDAVYTAAEIGSYKPDPRNFEYLLKHVKDQFGVPKSEILHVAQSLHHDHKPAADIGLESCWVDRGSISGSAEDVTGAKFGRKVNSIAELADLVDETFSHPD